jgi:hypothetical protein
LSEFQTSLGSHLRHPILGIGRAEQPDPLASEPFLGDPHKLLERFIAGIPKELDCAGGLSDSYTAWQIVNDGAPTRM